MSGMADTFLRGAGVDPDNSRLAEQLAVLFRFLRRFAEFYLYFKIKDEIMHHFGVLGPSLYVSVVDIKKKKNCFAA
jgi:hypothetical protein